MQADWNQHMPILLSCLAEPAASPAPCADGSLGDMLFFHTYKNPGLVLDIVQVGGVAGWVDSWLAG
jgi:hypothetical protein